MNNKIKRHGYYIKRQVYLVKQFIGQVVFIGLMIVLRKKTYVNKSTADAKIVNTDGKNGGWTGATVVSE